jgi:hypothetical protein
MSSSASSGRPYRRCTVCSLVDPVHPATWGCPAARATSMPRRIESIHDEQE